MAVIRRRSPELDKFLKAKRDGRLLGSVERHLQRREPEYRRWDILHPSALSKKGWCHRAAWYVVTSPTPPPPEKINRVSQSIFDEGHLIHDKWQGYFHGMGNLYGMWRCKVCAHTWWALSPEFCQHLPCRSQLIEYAEVPLEYSPWLIAGHADGWIRGIGEDCLIEIKSVGTGTVRYEAPNMFKEYDGDLVEIWKNLKRPFSSHLRQAQLYVRLLHMTRPEDAPREIVFLYECKANQQAKEFPIRYDEKFTDDIVAGALIVKAAVEAGEPPKCPNSIGGCDECKAAREYYGKASA